MPILEPTGETIQSPTTVHQLRRPRADLAVTVVGLAFQIWIGLSGLSRFWVATASLSVWASILLWLFWDWRRPTNAAKLGIALLTAVLVGVLTGRQYILEMRSGRPTEGGSLFLECRIVQSPDPPTSILHLLSLWPLPKENGGGGFAEMSSSDHSNVALPPANGLDHAYRCQFINYGAVPVFNVQVDFHLMFLTAVKNGPGSFSSGAMTLSRDWPVEIPKIEPGARNGFILYVVNWSPQFVEVITPQVAKFRLANDAEFREIPVMQATHYAKNFGILPSMNFAPHVEPTPPPTPKQ